MTVELTPEDIVHAHNNPGGDAWLRENGYGEHLNKYLEAVQSGRSWDPNDMSNVPPVPPASRLEQGMRTTKDVQLPEDEVPPYEEWNKPELAAECRERGLDSSGTKDDLVLRLMQDDEESEGEQEESIPDHNDYDLWKKAELVAECKKRGLATLGKNDELIARLQEDDAKKA